MFITHMAGTHSRMIYFFAALAFAIAAFLGLAGIAGISVSVLIGIVAAGLAILAIAAACGGGPAVTWRRAP
jgi:hypothetical protein